MVSRFVLGELVKMKRHSFEWVALVMFVIAKQDMRRKLIICARANGVSLAFLFKVLVITLLVESLKML